MGVQHADSVAGEGAVWLYPSAGPGGLVDRTAVGGLRQPVQDGDHLWSIERHFLHVWREQLDAVHLEQRPVEPIEIQGEKSGLLALRHLLGEVQQVVERLRWRRQSRLNEHRLVVIEKRLGDVEGK